VVEGKLREITCFLVVAREDKEYSLGSPPHRPFSVSLSKDMVGVLLPTATREEEKGYF
jgi:hypothetical protein